MTLPKFTIYFCLLGCLLGTACNQGDDEALIQEISEEFLPYTQRFEEAARLRGFPDILREQSLVVQFVPFNNPRFGNPVFTLAYCLNEEHPPIVNVNPSRWNSLNDQRREQLIFHELGHCILDRPHDNRLLDNQEPQSIMIAGELPNPDGNLIVNYSGFRKDYYVDELFNEGLAVPDWVTIQPTYEEVLGGQARTQEYLNFSLDNPTWRLDTSTCFVVEESPEGLLYNSICFRDEFLLLDFPTELEDRDFEIEFTLKLENAGRLAFVWGGNADTSPLELKMTRSLPLGIGAQDPELGTFGRFAAERWEDRELNRVQIVRRDNRYYFYLNDRFLYYNDFYPIQDGQLGFIFNASTRISLASFQLFLLE